MIKSVLAKNKKASFIFSVIGVAAASLCFAVETDWLTWSNQCLMQSFDPTADAKLKKWDISLTEDSFIRLRKTYQTGKQEYFSLHLQQLDSVAYSGDENTGTLQLKAKSDDIIVQTYHDRKGNVDTMASVLTIHVKNMEEDRLDSLKAAFNYFKTKNL